MKRPYRKLCISSINQNADFYFRGCDGFNIYAFLCEGAEHLRGNACVTTHPYTNYRYLYNICCATNISAANLRFCFVEHVHCAVKVTRGYGERQIGKTPVVGDVLDDHIDVDVRFRKWAEHASGDAWLIFYTQKCDFCFIFGIRNATYNPLFQDFILVTNK